MGLDRNERVARLKAAFEIGRHRLIEQARTSSAPAPDLVLETLGFVTARGEPVRGFLLRPVWATAPLPAILYIHAHGNRYTIGADELMHGRPAFDAPLGPVLARLGCAVLMIDLPCFGTRATLTESAAAKTALWHGRSLAGQMLGELASAVTWLAARPDIDASRIAAYGLSMGATFAYWLGAVDPRLSAVAHACCYADFATLIETGAHDLHGIYLTVPGLLDLADNGTIAGLIAPRPQWIGLGDQDPLTPPQAVDRALASTSAAYEAAGVEDRLTLYRQADLGHRESPAMRASLLAFLRDHGFSASGPAAPTG